ncbi:MAG: hypothetical protein AAF438_17145, partial [Pseudomonadota bacterium]
MDRRGFLAGVVSGLTVYGLPTEALSQATTTNKRFVFVLLRGGMDGLSAVVPYADPDYQHHRGGLAIPSPGEKGSIRLDADFALHPRLEFLASTYTSKELVVIPALASPYRQRSHF